MIQGMVPPWSSTNMGRLYLLRFRRRSGGAEGLRSRSYIHGFGDWRLLMGRRIITRPIMGVNIRMTKRGETSVNPPNV